MISFKTNQLVIFIIS